MSSSDIIENLSPVEILTLTIIGEARGEPIEGMVGVANVIRNRLRHEPGRYKSYADVCLARLQFSCWNEDDPNRAVLLELGQVMLAGQQLTQPSYRQCYWVAKGINESFLVDNTKLALNYITNGLFFSDKRPRWARAVTDYKIIGSHVFFTAV